MHLPYNAVVYRQFEDFSAFGIAVGTNIGTEMCHFVLFSLYEEEKSFFLSES